jgi:hypothetical protein
MVGKNSSIISTFSGLIGGFPPSAPIKSGTSCILQGACFFMSRHVAYKEFPRISNEYKRPPAAPRNMNATWVGM